MSKSKVVETSFRVYYFGKSLIASWRKARDRRGETNLAFITEATDKHLAPVVRELRAIGMTGLAAERQPVRLEMPVRVLADLADASERTGVPSSTLLSICLQRASAAKPKRVRKC
jgi:hypothetical protein